MHYMGRLPHFVPPERGTFFRLEVYKRVGRGFHESGSIDKGGENCHLGMKWGVLNTSERLHLSKLRGFSSEKFSKSRSVAI